MANNAALILFTINCWIISELEVLSMEGVTQNATDYNFYAPEEPKIFRPNSGYEPYWENGEKVFEDDPLKPTTKGYKVCGADCNPIYNNVGKICAHKSNQNEYASCRNYSIECYESNYDAIISFITFEHFCLFLDARCRSKQEERLVLVHIGECIQHKEIYKPVYVPEEPASRMYSYLTRLHSVLAHEMIGSTTEKIKWNISHYG